jgi:(1->4)-alpha-D-glucan 1-alpha-D-glucosylmutase
LEREAVLLPRIPSSTYRLQFNSQFKFIDAKNIIGYLNDLGINDIYASPYFKAKEGSLHGYDIVSPTSLNPEIGTENDYNGFIQELENYGMGQILDIVPNHMCIDKDNTWWIDVLENGPSSLYANLFDINWEPVKKELKNKILLPILGDQYGNILENQELRLAFEEGAFFLYYYDNKFPIIPKTYKNILKHRLDTLENLLSPNHPTLGELLSIITALDHLPPYTVSDPEKISERYREKEIIKKRLKDLYQKSPEIRTFLDENIRIFNGNKGNHRSFNLLDKLLSQQAYRLSFWRVATEEINYRRFFDINSLAAIRIENHLVFMETHALIMKLIKEGKVTGLRIDHPDGLYNPSEYFHQLQRHCFFQVRLGFTENVKKEIPPPYEDKNIEAKILKHYDDMLSSDPQFKPFYIIGEKILLKGERIPEDWQIFSTTGYAFLNSANGIFVDTKNAKAFDDIYTKFTRVKENFHEIVYEKKKLIMQVAMSSEIYNLGHYLDMISEKNRHTRDFTLNSLINAITEVIAFFPVYRTYINSWIVHDRDRQYIDVAVLKAKRKNPAMSASIFDFLRDVLLLRFPENLDEKEKRECLDFVMRFQQLTGPVMAKGLEDTACYVYNRFISLNEVGGSPDRFGTPLETFHGQNFERIKFWPHALITTATHDTKRSEDARARINVLSEIPQEWKKQFTQWAKINKKRRVVVDSQTVPERNEEYLLYQTLISTWPISIQTDEEYEIFKTRIKEYMVKALREAKVNTSWINPNTIYEDALMVFIDSILNNLSDNKFLTDFLPFQKKISSYGMFNSLSQTLLKTACPGVPDFYQGTELWDYRLVDPDNRGPVDYELRKRLLEDMRKRKSEMPLQDLAKWLTINKDNGMIKLFLISQALHYRRDAWELFYRGDYIPLEVIGEKADNVCVFARRTGSACALVIAPRFFTRLAQPEDMPFGASTWEDTAIVMAFDETGKRYRNIFTDEIITTKDYTGATIIYLSEVFTNFPVAFLERID